MLQKYYDNVRIYKNSKIRVYFSYIYHNIIFDITIRCTHYMIYAKMVLLSLSLSLPLRDIKTHVFYTHSQRLLTALSNASSKSNGLPFLN